MADVGGVNPRPAAVGSLINKRTTDKWKCSSFLRFLFFFPTSVSATHRGARTVKDNGVNFVN